MISRSSLVLLAGLVALANGMVREGWFETRVDHFSPRNMDTFSMRYYSNDEHAYAKGPIFVIVGSNGPIETRYLREGLFYDTAYLEGAYLFANEHRYFGHSLPVDDASTENLDFLTVDQALADLAAWIHHLRHEVVGNPQAKVILMGWGYGGSLATWFHTQFPHLSDGVWVSSGNNNADLDLPEYMESLGNTIGEFGGRDCYSTIFSSFLVAQNLIELDRSELLTEMFHLCDDLNTDNRWDTTAFLLGLQRDIEDEMMHLRNTMSTTYMCVNIQDPEIGNSLYSLRNWFAREHQYEQCVNLGFEHYMAPLLETNFDDEDLQAGHRQRLYLQCTALGFFPTTDSILWLPYRGIHHLGVFRTNARFGGRQPDIANVHFTHGDIDPMMLTGITSDLNDDAPATVIPNTFFAPDLESIDYENDSPELIEAKERTRTLIDIWIYQGFEPIAV
ncbi:hypothetical protein pipiens_006416 [Culex pipiens pipiens]|uniref:Lysosomal pro-X carboxypeptidase n=1 Tax=Culex pipiens pipiens TaxID=38569 RepID=A0ABD1DRA2_CULPP